MDRKADLRASKRHGERIDRHRGLGGSLQMQPLHGTAHIHLRRIC
jgi:hypothetical protein